MTARAPPVPDVEMEDGGQPEEENLESTDPNYEIHVAARERAMNALMNLVDGTLEINDRILTFCVVCRDPRPLWPNAHSMKEWWQQSTVVRKSCAKLFAGIRNTEDLVICLPLRIPPQPSYVCSFLGQATQSQSTTSPWRRNYHSDLILIQYDTQHNCGHEIANRRGAFLICGVDIAEVGPDNNDKVIELIETISDHRPLPSATWRSTNICSGPTFGALRERRIPKHCRRCSRRNLGPHANQGYTKFFHREWEHVNTCIPGNMRYGAMNHAKWALSCIQSDLPHRLA